MKRALGWLLLLAGCSPVARPAVMPPPPELLHAAPAVPASDAGSAMADAFVYIQSPDATPEGIAALGPLIAQIETAQANRDRRKENIAVHALQAELHVLKGQ
jgi:hypothetical protein